MIAKVYRRKINEKTQKPLKSFEKLLEFNVEKYERAENRAINDIACQIINVLNKKHNFEYDIRAEGRTIHVDRYFWFYEECVFEDTFKEDWTDIYKIVFSKPLFKNKPRAYDF